MGSLSSAGLLEKGSRLEFVDATQMGEISFSMDVGFKNWEKNDQLSLKNRSLSQSQAIQLQGELSQYDFANSGGSLNESYGLHETRWEFRPSLGFKLDYHWKILMTANMVSSSYAFDRQLNGDPSIYATQALNESYRSFGIRPPVDHQRDYWKSLEVVSQFDFYQSSDEAYGWIMSLEIPMSDQMNEYSLVNPLPNESQMDIELGLLAQNRWLSPRLKQGLYVFYRAQLESKASLWKEDPVNPDKLISEQVSRDVGDQIGIEIAHRFEAGARWAIRAAYEYVHQYKDKINNMQPAFDALLNDSSETQHLALESIWHLGRKGWSANVRVERPLQSSEGDPSAYSMGLSKVF
tara:strand:+ start:210771 stop:211820 length:1050 start_codon:yes stop_codon:yes gene_type:complete